MSLLDNVRECFDLRDYAYATEVGALNLWGIRGPVREAGAWDDIIGATRVVDGREELYAWQATTDPGRTYLRKPLHERGTAILAAEQHVACWRRGLHRGKHPALRQVAPMLVHRDDTQDDLLQEVGPPGAELVGINLHATWSQRLPEVVGPWSAGCQVIRNPRDLDKVLDLVRDHERAGHSTRITYTLFDAREIPVAAYVWKLLRTQTDHRAESQAAALS